MNQMHVKVGNCRHEGCIFCRASFQKQMVSLVRTLFDVETVSLINEAPLCSMFLVYQSVSVSYPRVLLINDDFLVSRREHNLQQCGQTVYGESATRRGLPELSPQVKQKRSYLLHFLSFSFAKWCFAFEKKHNTTP